MKTDRRHTLGQWKVQPYLTPDLDDDPMGVYSVQPVQDELTVRYFAADPETPELDAVHAENVAYARLIEAAPDLLQAARCALADLEGFVESNFTDLVTDDGKTPTPVGQTIAELIAELKAAIAKAEGET